MLYLKQKLYIGKNYIKINKIILKFTQNKRFDKQKQTRFS